MTWRGSCRPSLVPRIALSRRVTKSDRDAAVAESGHDVGLGNAGEAGLGQPRRQFGEQGFVHAAIIQAFVTAPPRSDIRQPAPKGAIMGSLLARVDK